MSQQQRTILIAAVAALVAFAIGAGWQYASSRPAADRLAVVERDLAFQQMEATLGTATIEAQRGSFEIARQMASDFYTQLQQNYQRADPDRQQAFAEILAGRDAMITALSRSDPQTGSMLAQVFTRYRIAMGEPVGPEADTRSAPPPATPAPRDS